MELTFAVDSVTMRKEPRSESGVVLSVSLSPDSDSTVSGQVWLEFSTVEDVAKFSKLTLGVPCTVRIDLPDKS